MSRWHAIRIRDDLYRVIQAQAAEMSRSATGQLDFVLSRALEQETKNLSVDGEAHRGTAPLVPTSSPARAPVAQRQTPEMEGLRNIAESLLTARQIEGQTTVDEMLASCPNCAGAFVEHDAGAGAGTIQLCEGCGYVRDAT